MGPTTVFLITAVATVIPVITDEGHRDAVSTGTFKLMWLTMPCCFREEIQRIWSNGLIWTCFTGIFDWWFTLTHCSWIHLIHLDNLVSHYSAECCYSKHRWHMSSLCRLGNLDSTRGNSMHFIGIPKPDDFFITHHQHTILK